MNMNEGSFNPIEKKTETIDKVSYVGKLLEYAKKFPTKEVSGGVILLAIAAGCADQLNYLKGGMAEASQATRDTRGLYKPASTFEEHIDSHFDGKKFESTDTIIKTGRQPNEGFHGRK